MKKTISLTALAVSASAASFALIGPPQDTKTYCLDSYTDMSGSMMAGTCDQSRNNARSGAQLGENGCAAGQIALTTGKYPGEREFPIRISPCMPPNVTQL